MRHRTIAIVGGGFTGTTLATRLLREASAEPMHIVLIERSAELGRGVAYALHDHPYLLNVPAGQMSADSARPADFLEFVRQRGIEAGPDDFLPRSLYGDYLRARLDEARRAAGAVASFSHVQGEAVHMVRASRDSRPAWRITMADGRDIVADEVVLALGNPPPRAFHPCVQDPWRDDDARRPHERVLLMGTGLTMVDMVVRLFASPAPPDSVIAISPHGLLPAPQALFARKKARRCDEWSVPEDSLRKLVRQVRTRARAATAEGRDWREIIGELRSCAPSLWSQLSVHERRRFLRHVRSYWDIHRHRVPEEVAARLEELRAAGKLQVHAGRILEIRRLETGVRVTWRARGTSEPVTLTVDRVVNCTGPDYRPRHSTQPLVKNLLQAGLITPDQLDLGIEVASTGEVLDARRCPVRGLYYVGPWLRARYWEATAVPELREHVAALARHLARPVQRTSPLLQKRARSLLDSAALLVLLVSAALCHVAIWTLLIRAWHWAGLSAMQAMLLLTGLLMALSAVRSYRNVRAELVRSGARRPGRHASAVRPSNAAP